MNIGTIIAVVVVIGYIAFEVSTLYQLRHRMEPLYVFDEFVTADRATAKCGAPGPEERDDFLRNFAVVERNALADLAETSPNDSTEAHSAMLEQLRNDRIQEVDLFIEENGCQDQMAWRWVKLHEVRARLNLR